MDVDSTTVPPRSATRTRSPSPDTNAPLADALRGHRRLSDRLHSPTGRRSAQGGASGGGGVLQAKFNQDASGVQEEHVGGVRCQYAAGVNEFELHIEAGANQQGTLMTDFLRALWLARDTLSAGGGRAPGVVVMHPGGVQVVKMTMELLGEALGTEGGRDKARAAKAIRKEDRRPVTQGVKTGKENDVLGAPIVPEHLAYMGSLERADGVEVRAISRDAGLFGVDDLTAEANYEARDRYRTAVAEVAHAISLNVRLSLPALKRVISSIEGQMTWLQRLALKLK